MEGLESQVIQIHPTPLEYWLSTSDAVDNNYLESLTEKGMSLKEAISKVSEKYSQGTK